jgi:hypothetical protein
MPTGTAKRTSKTPIPIVASRRPLGKRFKGMRAIVGITQNASHMALPARAADFQVGL